MKAWKRSTKGGKGNVRMAPDSTQACATISSLALGSLLKEWKPLVGSWETVKNLGRPEIGSATAHTQLQPQRALMFPIKHIGFCQRDRPRDGEQG